MLLRPSPNPRHLRPHFGRYGLSVWLVWALLSASALYADDVELVTESDEIGFGKRQPPGKEAGDAADEEETSLMIWGLEQMEARRNWLSRHYVGMWRGLDRYFTDPSADDMENDSQLRLQLRQSFFNAGEAESDARVRVRVDLPNTEKKLKLFFNSDEDNTVEERIREVSTGERIKRESSVSGIEFSPDKKDRKWRRKFSGGVRLRDNLVPYVKFKIKREWGEENNRDWHTEFRQEVEYFDDEERWGESTDLTVSKPFADVYIFRVWSEAEFKDEFNVYEFAHVYTVSRIYSDRAALHYRVGAVGASQPVPRVNGVFYGLGWDYQLYKDWVYLGISPEVFYPRELNWSAEPSVTFRLEVFFTE
ncbi:MAG: hypothetical protein CMN85_00735 [Spongiibacteraceae bacterium]|nr:hypothetical protein [Spongiibacteraceae bacterium]